MPSKGSKPQRCATAQAPAFAESQTPDLRWDLAAHLRVLRLSSSLCFYAWALLTRRQKICPRSQKTRSVEEEDQDTKPESQRLFTDSRVLSTDSRAGHDGYRHVNLNPWRPSSSRTMPRKRPTMTVSQVRPAKACKCVNTQCRYLCHGQICGEAGKSLCEGCDISREL